MKKQLDPLGRVLLGAGVLDDDALEDILKQQGRPMPLASLAFVLGHAEEDALARALSKQRGMPGVVLSRSVVRLTTIADVPRDYAIRNGLLPMLEDDARVFVAVSDAADPAVVREMQFVRGKAVVAHLALHVVLQRAIRRAYRALEAGDEYWFGDDAGPEDLVDEAGVMFVVSDVDELPVEVMTLTDPEAPGTLEETTDSLDDVDYAKRHLRAVEFSEGDRSGAPAGPFEEQATAGARIVGAVALGNDTDSFALARDAETTAPAGPSRILVVDDDLATRQLLVKQFEHAGYLVESAAGGMEAIQRLKLSPPDLVIVDVMLPEINGFQICRSIKNSHKYRHIPVILISAVIDSARVNDQVLLKYSADAYFEKPLATDRIKRKVVDLLRGRPAPTGASSDDGSFERALELYRQGRIDEAVETLQAGLAIDPLSTRHHFVLANLLQRQNAIYEAIDEYEATINLKPDYFPALSRLAYLYYKKGFSAKAVETWRRSLPHCPDPALRQNIEAFMRRLISQMHAES